MVEHIVIRQKERDKMKLKQTSKQWEKTVINIQKQSETVRNNQKQSETVRNKLKTLKNC